MTFVDAVITFTLRRAPDKSFARCVQEATSWNSLLYDFGYSTGNRLQNIESIKRRCRKLGVTYDHLTLVKGQIPWCYRCTDARFEEIISNSQTWMSVMIALGKFKITSQAKNMIKKRCNELGVNYEHINKRVKKRARDDVDADEATGAYNPWLAPGCRLDEPGWRYD